jgi:predicted nucleotidyltransferase
VRSAGAAAHGQRPFGEVQFPTAQTWSPPVTATANAFKAVAYAFDSAGKVAVETRS